MAEERVRTRRARTGRPAGTGAARRRERTLRIGRTSLDRTRSRASTVVAATSGLLGVSSTRRAAILAVVVCALALTVTVPLRNYVAQRQELAAISEQQETLGREVGELTAERARLSDPAEIAAEARSRLGFVAPGEVPYVVQLPQDPAAAAEADPFRDEPWYRQLWRDISAGAP